MYKDMHSYVEYLQCILSSVVIHMCEQDCEMCVCTLYTCSWIRVKQRLIVSQNYSTVDDRMMLWLLKLAIEATKDSSHILTFRLITNNWMLHTAQTSTEFLFYFRSSFFE